MIAPAVVTRNDPTPVAEDLIKWVQKTVRALEQEKLAHLEAKASRLFLKTVADIYQSVSEGMVLKNKEEEHKPGSWTLNPPNRGFPSHPWS